MRRLLNCTSAMESLRTHTRSSPRGVEVPSADADLAFEMVTDDYNKTAAQLASVRARKPKFICINDDMQAATPETRALLTDFYEALLPRRSSFELPPGQENAPLHIDELRRNALQRELARGEGVSTAATAVLASGSAFAALAAATLVFVMLRGCFLAVSSSRRGVSSYSRVIASPSRSPRAKKTS